MWQCRRLYNTYVRLAHRACSQGRDSAPLAGLAHHASPGPRQGCPAPRLRGMRYLLPLPASAELAFVSIAVSCSAGGCVPCCMVTTRVTDNVFTKTIMVLVVFQILATFPFTSETKRMGIVVKEKTTGKITYYMKGADTVMAKIVHYNDWCVAISPWQPAWGRASSPPSPPLLSSPRLQASIPPPRTYIHAGWTRRWATWRERAYGPWWWPSALCRSLSGKPSMPRMYHAY